MEELCRIFRPGSESPMKDVLGEIKKWMKKKKNDELTAIELVVKFMVSFVKEVRLPRDAYRVFCGLSVILCTRTKYLKVSKCEKTFGLLLRYCSAKDGPLVIGNDEHQIIRQYLKKWELTRFFDPEPIINWRKKFPRPDKTETGILNIKQESSDSHEAIVSSAQAEAHESPISPTPVDSPSQEASSPSSPTVDEPQQQQQSSNTQPTNQTLLPLPLAIPPALEESSDATKPDATSSHAEVKSTKKPHEKEHEKSMKPGVYYGCDNESSSYVYHTTSSIAAVEEQPTGLTGSSCALMICEFLGSLSTQLKAPLAIEMTAFELVHQLANAYKVIDTEVVSAAVACFFLANKICSDEFAAVRVNVVLKVAERVFREHPAFRKYIPLSATHCIEDLKPDVFRLEKRVILALNYDFSLRPPNVAGGAIDNVFRELDTMVMVEDELLEKAKSLMYDQAYKFGRFCVDWSRETIAMAMLTIAADFLNRQHANSLHSHSHSSSNSNKSTTSYEKHRHTAAAAAASTEGSRSSSSSSRSHEQLETQQQHQQPGELYEPSEWPGYLNMDKKKIYSLLSRLRHFRKLTIPAWRKRFAEKDISHRHRDKSESRGSAAAAAAASMIVTPDCVSGFELLPSSSSVYPFTANLTKNAADGGDTAAATATATAVTRASSSSSSSSSSKQSASSKPESDSRGRQGCRDYVSSSNRSNNSDSGRPPRRPQSPVPSAVVATVAADAAPRPRRRSESRNSSRGRRTATGARTDNSSTRDGNSTRDHHTSNSYDNDDQNSYDHAGYDHIGYEYGCAPHGDDDKEGTSTITAASTKAAVAPQSSGRRSRDDEDADSPTSSRQPPSSSREDVVVVSRDKESRRPHHSYHEEKEGGDGRDFKRQRTGRGAIRGDEDYNTRGARGPPSYQRGDEQSLHQYPSSRARSRERHKDARPRQEGSGPRPEDSRPRHEDARPRQEGSRPRPEDSQPRQEHSQSRQENSRSRQEGSRPRQEGRDYGRRVEYTGTESTVAGGASNTATVHRKRSRSPPTEGDVSSSKRRRNERNSNIDNNDTRLHKVGDSRAEEKSSQGGRKKNKNRRRDRKIKQQEKRVQNIKNSNSSSHSGGDARDDKPAAAASKGGGRSNHYGPQTDPPPVAGGGLSVNLSRGVDSPVCNRKKNEDVDHNDSAVRPFTTTGAAATVTGATSATAATTAAAPPPLTSRDRDNTSRESTAAVLSSSYAVPVAAQAESSYYDHYHSSQQSAATSRTGGIGIGIGISSVMDEEQADYDDL